MAKKHYIGRRLLKRTLAAVQVAERHPPALVNELLRREDVQQFISPETRGPQEPAGYQAPVGHFIDPETAVIARSLVGLMLVVFGFILGKFL